MLQPGPLGLSDHRVILLLPKHRPLIKINEPVTKSTEPEQKNELKHNSIALNLQTHVVNVYSTHIVKVVYGLLIFYSVKTWLLHQTK